MNYVIPFTRDVEFSSNVAEIVSISLEHDYTLNDGEILGNFTIFGEYKPHEISVNKEKFEFVLPFEVQIDRNIDPNSINLNIENFEYELKGNKTLHGRT